VLAVGLNVCESIGCSLRAIQGKPEVSFLIFAVVAFALAGLMRAGCAMLDVNQGLHLTWFGPAMSQLNFYGFFTMAMFGAVYIIMPRLFGIELPWPRLVRAHFWLSAAGVVLLVVPLAFAGIFEELKLADAQKPFTMVMHSTLAFLRVSTLGDLLLLIGHVFFLANLTGVVLGFYRARAVTAYAELTADLFKPARARS
jgi:cytochrome c oxidase cbb3-type subunit 1